MSICTRFFSHFEFLTLFFSLAYVPRCRLFLSEVSCPPLDPANQNRAVLLLPAFPDLPLVVVFSLHAAKQSTGNTKHASYVVQSNDLRFLCTAPYSLATARPQTTSAATAESGAPSPPSSSSSSSSSPLPGFDPAAAHEFFRRHGLAGRVSKNIFWFLLVPRRFWFVFVRHTLGRQS